MPDVPPVTRATFPLNVLIRISLYVISSQPDGGLVGILPRPLLDRFENGIKVWLNEGRPRVRGDGTLAE